MLCKGGLVFSILIAIALAFAIERFSRTWSKTVPQNGLLAQTMVLGAFGVILAPMVVLYITFCGNTPNIPIWCEYRPVISLLISFPFLMLYQWGILPKLGIDPYSFAKIHMRVAFDIPFSIIFTFSVIEIIYSLTDSICQA